MSFFREHQQADHRVIARILELSHGIGDPSVELLDELSNNFIKNKGSWVKFFNSNPTHSKLLKLVIKKTIKQKRGE